MRLADTVAAELAQRAWLGIDAPVNDPDLSGVRLALSEALPGEVTLEDVGEWAQPALAALISAPSRFALEGRLIGALSAALILGAKLQETQGT